MSNEKTALLDSLHFHPAVGQLGLLSLQTNTAARMRHTRIDISCFLLVCLFGPFVGRAFFVLPAIVGRSPFSFSTVTTTTALCMGLRGKKIRREKRRARKEPTPPRIVTPYGPIRMPRPPRVCEVCRGRGAIRCNVCEGRRVVRATGDRRRNQLPPAADKLPGTLWTAVTTREGHRHYKILETQGSKRKANLQARMTNCCGDPVSFWVPAEELQDKACWRKGWVTLEAILEADGGALYDVALCFRCKGERILDCIDCGGTGEIETYEPLYDD